MAIPAFVQPSAQGVEQRRHERRALRLLTQATLGAGDRDTMLIRNISETGLLLESGSTLAVGDRLEIDLPHAGGTWAKVVWTSDRLLGCRFDAPLSSATLSAVRLRGTPPPPAMPDEPFGARLQRLRVRKGLTQAELADGMGVSAPSVSGWEKGRVRPRHDRVAALAERLGVPLFELLGLPASETLPEESPETLDELIDHSREWIARAIGVSPDQIRITVDL
ncbi:MAG: XRE family transcriptional regulator [Alphaproteobacteria bacterium HGW-Alphaproteobacteria-13]|jgi:transcriptional regulator with XRE-family HTH domain|nr:MAG: XRE family transcriptional regulator [Alphaproteobacteria bacterium HGW-Alphaproteobacteria-13]